MNKACLILLTLVSFSACTDIKKGMEEAEVESKKVTGIIHTMYNGKVKLEMDPKYERFNVEELKIVAENQPKTSFINQVFDYKRLDFLTRLGQQFYVFIDTSTYEEIIHFERMNKRTDIDPGKASVIGGMFMESLREAVGEPDANIDIQEAKYGTQKTFKFGYYKMAVETDGPLIHSNQFIITSRGSTYTMYSLGINDVDHYNLQHNISFND